jgi:hypothetical protein
MDTIEGRVERGGDGRHDKGLSKDVRELMTAEVGAMDGDCSGDCTGSSLLQSSARTGGSKGVLAWQVSSSSSTDGFWSMSMGSVSPSKEVSLGKGKLGDDATKLSCLEMALSAGLSTCDEISDSERDAEALIWVTMESWGPGTDRFFHRRESEPILLLRR